MYLAELRIENFRGIKNARLQLKRRTLLIGSNNVGKTTILEAAALLLGRDRMVFDLSEWDFFNGRMFWEDSDAATASAEADTENDVDQAPTAIEDLTRGADGDIVPKLTPIRIRISGVLAALSRDEQRLFCHPSRAGALAAWDPKAAKLFERPARSGEEAAVRVAYEAQFDVEEGEVVSKRFFPMDGEDPFAGDPTDPLRRQHVQMAGYFLLSSTRLWKDAVRFTSSIFGSLLRQRQVHAGDQVRLIARSLETLQPKAHDAVELKELLKSLRETIGRFISVAGDDPLGFEVTELSSPDVERALTMFLRGARDERRFPMSRHGSAAVSIQILAMLVMLGRHRKAQGQTFMLGLEEPELHLHPHAQRNLVSAVREEATQLLVTTHSPAITECFKPDEVCVLSVDKGTLTGQYLLDYEVEDTTKNLVKRWVFTRRKLFAESLISPAILLVEGETEADLLPALTTLVQGQRSFDELGCTVVQGDGSNLPTVLPMLQRFPGLRVVLVDGDSEGDIYVEQIRRLPADQQPQVVLRLPKGKAFEKALAHGLADDQAKKVLDELRSSCPDIGVHPPQGDGQADLEAFFVESKPKKNPRLRDAIADAFRSAGKVPPVVAEIQQELATSLAVRPPVLTEKRLGQST